MLSGSIEMNESSQENFLIASLRSLFFILKKATLESQIPILFSRKPASQRAYFELHIALSQISHDNLFIRIRIHDDEDHSISGFNTIYVQQTKPDNRRILRKPESRFAFQKSDPSLRRTSLRRISKS